MKRTLPTLELIYTDWQQFVILKKLGEVAVMAGCARCGRKFFTPSTLFPDAFGAEEYLRGKFEIHDCQLRSAPL
jgi:hypothetical protein